MKRIISLLLFLISTPIALAANVGGVEMGSIMHYLTPAFQLFKTLIVTDLSRTVITFILLFIVISRVLSTAIKKTPLSESANIISNAFAGIILIAMFYKARGFLDRFSWIIIIFGLVVLFWSLFGRFFRKIFSGKQGSYGDYVKGQAKQAKKHEDLEEKTEKHIKDDEKEEKEQGKKESKELEKREEILNELEKFERLIRNPDLSEQNFVKIINDGKHHIPILTALSKNVVDSYHDLNKDMQLLKDEFKTTSDAMKIVNHEEGIYTPLYSEFHRKREIARSQGDSKFDNLYNSIQEKLSLLLENIELLKRDAKGLEELDLKQKSLLEPLMNHLKEVLQLIQNVPKMNNRKDFVSLISRIKEFMRKFDKFEENLLHDKSHLRQKKEKLIDDFEKRLDHKNYLIKKFKKLAIIESELEENANEAMRKAEEFVN